MVRPRFTRVGMTTTAAITCLVAAAVASGAVSRSFRGRTSQRQPISLRVSGGFVRKLDYHIVDKCPAGLRLVNHDFGFPRIRLAHSKFAGTFRDPVHQGKAVVSGAIRRGMAEGSIRDRTRSVTTHRICTGRAKFRLHAR